MSEWGITKESVEKADQYARDLFDALTKAEDEGTATPEMAAKLERALKYALRLGTLYDSQITVTHPGLDTVTDDDVGGRA